MVVAVTAVSASVDKLQTKVLISRATNTCGAPNFQSCNHPGLPSSFCCPTGSDCILFNNALSVVCCPSGGDCKTIAPLTCDISQQNATLHPANQLHSTDLNGTLDKCGSACCPKGFSCQNNQCVMANSAATSSKPDPSSTAKPSNTTTGLGVKSSSPQNAAQCDKWPVLAILAGFFPGVLLGVLITVIAVTYLGHRRNKNRESSDLGSVVAKPSDPIYSQDNNFRTDFLRRDSRSNQRGSRARSFFSRSPTIRNPDNVGPSFKQPITPIRTPKMQREPSTESIKIYSPPNGGLGTPHTTFADMMNHAGLRVGDPYLANSPFTTPDKRTTRHR